MNSTKRKLLKTITETNCNNKWKKLSSASNKTRPDVTKKTWNKNRKSMINLMNLRISIKRKRTPRLVKRRLLKKHLLLDLTKSSLTVD